MSRIDFRIAQEDSSLFTSDKKYLVTSCFFNCGRFVRKFSKQSITFSKIQKQIKCEITNSGSPNVTYQQSANRTYTDPQTTVPSFDGTPVSDFDIDDVWEETG